MTIPAADLSGYENGSGPVSSVEGEFAVAHEYGHRNNRFLVSSAQFRAFAQFSWVRDLDCNENDMLSEADKCYTHETQWDESDFPGEYLNTGGFYGSTSLPEDWAQTYAVTVKIDGDVDMWCTPMICEPDHLADDSDANGDGWCDESECTKKEYDKLKWMSQYLDLGQGFYY